MAIVEVQSAFRISRAPKHHCKKILTFTAKPAAIVFAWIAGVMPCALAQSPVSLGLNDVLAAVEQHSPEFAVASQNELMAQAEGSIARAYPNPDIEVGFGPWRSRMGMGAGTAQSMGIAQSIELPSVRAARAEAAEFGSAAARALSRNTRLTIGYQTQQAFYELLRRQEDERLAAENQRLLEQILGRVLARVQVGEAPRLELVRAESESLAARNAAASASLRVEEARATLRRLAANMLPMHFVARGDLPIPPNAPPLAELQTRVLEAHPTLHAALAERDRALAKRDQERALRSPQPRLRLGESRDPEVRQLMIGVEFSIPLWNRREGQIAQAQAGADLAGAHFDLQRTHLLRELDSAHARLAIANRLIETFEAGLLRAAENALRVAEAAYRFGERGFIEVLDAQRTLRSVKSDYNQARFERQSAWLDIERLLARDPFGISRG
jgi:cobalt-zinc-cadmium efflux system outer membrane protein